MPKFKFIGKERKRIHGMWYTPNFIYDLKSMPSNSFIMVYESTDMEEYSPLNVVSSSEELGVIPKKKMRIKKV